jgi:cell wall-associated NlpC family hydrolase
MRELRLTRWFAAMLAVLLLAPGSSSRAADPSLGQKIKEFFATPTPTPTPAHHRSKKKSATKTSPTPSPTPSPHKKSKASPDPEEEPTPRKKKKKSSPTPSPSPTPPASPSPPESPSPSPEESPSPSPTSSPSVRVATVAPDEIEDFEKNPEPVRKLLSDALHLTKQNLDYKYGSADPAGGGMDCSGFIYFVLRENGVKDVPRSASEQYVWVRKAGNFRAVLSRELDSFELDELRPGDLLFWTGTYNVERDPPVTHTMIYLGVQKDSGKPIMVGASDGRTYEGEQQFGVSVFDFKTVRSKQASTSGTHPRFVGYAKIPGLGETSR